MIHFKATAFTSSAHRGPPLTELSTALGSFRLVSGRFGVRVPASALVLVGNIHLAILNRSRSVTRLPLVTHSVIGASVARSWSGGIDKLPSGALGARLRGGHASPSTALRGPGCCRDGWLWCKRDNR